VSDFATRPAQRARSAASSRAALDLTRVVLGDDSPIHVTFPDGSTHGPSDAAMRITIRSTDAFAHMLRAPGELGLARAYVSGAIDVEGDIGVAITLQERIENTGLAPLRPGLALVRAVGIDALRNPPPPPPEEIAQGHRTGFRRHSKKRDASSISHHYDVSNDFYRLVLGPSMTYSCAAFSSEHDSLELAQQNKYELVCRKLGLQPGMRLLDVGCGWGSMVIHAAKHHGVRAVGVTISREQYEYARHAVIDAGLEHMVEIRLQDYRDIADGPFDAISSIGMFEHVGLSQLEEYFVRLKSLLREEGRLLNHQIGRPPGNIRFGRERTDLNPRGFVQRYVFPDGELHEVGDLAHSMQTVGFEVRHIESLREHYARTLRFWGDNLDDQWTRAATMVGEGRARVWKLYMAGSAVLFDANLLQIHQVLAVNVSPTGSSSMPLRPVWDHRLTAPGDQRDDASSVDTERANAHDAGAHVVIDLRDPTSTV
jgi:cyclopropane-fatty-acyl-phospholipid synthase